MTHAEQLAALQGKLEAVAAERDAYHLAAARMRQATIEECAKVCEEYADYSRDNIHSEGYHSAAAHNLAFRIRALQAADTACTEPFGEDGPDSEGFRGPRPWNGFASPNGSAGSVPEQQPFAYFQMNEGWNTWEQVASNFKDSEGVVAAYRHPVAASTAAPADAVDIANTLKAAFQLGQKYWMEADSESYAANKRSDATLAKFNVLVADTCAALSAAPAIPEGMDSFIAAAKAFAQAHINCDEMEARDELGEGHVSDHEYTATTNAYNRTKRELLQTYRAMLAASPSATKGKTE